MTDRLAQATGQGGASSGAALNAVNDVRYPVHGDWCTHHPFVDASVPNVARIYDYLLGGKDNYSADRDAAVELVRLIPDALRAPITTGDSSSGPYVSLPPMPACASS